MAQTFTKDHLFYKKQIFQKYSQIFLTLGVDQYLDQDFPDADSSLQPDWQAIQYQIKQCQPGPKQFFDTLSKHQFAKHINPPNSISYYWNIRRNEALVQFYKCTSSPPTTVATCIQQKLISKICEINSKWQFEGIYIFSFVAQAGKCILIIEIKSKILQFEWDPANSSNQDLLFAIKYYLLSKIFNDLHFSLENGPEKKISIAGLPVEDKIQVVYKLNEEYGLTLCLDRKTRTISDKLLTRSSTLSYRHTIAYLIQICSKLLPQLSFKSEVMAVVESGESQMQLSFKRLYFAVVSRTG